MAVVSPCASMFDVDGLVEETVVVQSGQAIAHHQVLQHAVELLEFEIMCLEPAYQQPVVDHQTDLVAAADADAARRSAVFERLSEVIGGAGAQGGDGISQ